MELVAGGLAGLGFIWGEEDEATEEEMSMSAGSPGCPTRQPPSGTGYPACQKWARYRHGGNEPPVSVGASGGQHVRPADGVGEVVVGEVSW